MFVVFYSCKSDYFVRYSSLLHKKRCYGYWKSGVHESPAVFELFFRETPFKGEYCLFAGLEEVLRFVSSFKFSEEDISFLEESMPHVEKEFWSYLKAVDCKGVTLRAIKEGSVVFSKIPLIQVVRFLSPFSLSLLLSFFSFFLFYTNFSFLKNCRRDQWRCANCLKQLS